MNNIKKQSMIKVTVLFENSFWIGLFERNDSKGYAVARKIFGGEPTDAELYEFENIRAHLGISIKRVILWPLITTRMINT